jgi:hypothetical protein
MISKIFSQPEFIDPNEKKALESAGSSMVVSMLVAVGVNALFSFLSSGSMELMWSFLNVV